MKCPKCQQNIPDHMAKCPLCQADLTQRGWTGQETGRFSAVDPSKDSYDFDLQYTLTFKDAGEIRQTIADMDLGLGKEGNSEMFPEKKNAPEVAKPERRQRTMEEMEEAAKRAELRRQRRASGGKRVPGERISRREKEKAAALRNARARRKPTEQENRKRRRLFFGGIVAVLVVALIIGSINLVANMMSGDVTYPTLYTKGNQLYLYYNKKPVQLSSNFISAYAPVEDEDANGQTTASGKLEDPKRYKAETATEKQLIHVSADGLYTYFMENIDLNTGRGDLVYCKNDSPKTRTLVSISVYYKVVISKDGQSILFLRKTDDEGYHGELCYWNPSMEEALSIDGDVCADQFVFAQNGQKALYMKNFDEDKHLGDLYQRAFGKEAPQESNKLDEEVAFVFGTSAKGDFSFYAKDYDTKSGTYTLYSVKDGENPAVRAEKAFLAPVILTKTEGVYAYSNFKDGFQTVKYLDLTAGTGNVVADEVTRIERLRNDEMAIIYSKSYEETNKSDYYMATATENVSQKVANAVSHVEEDSAKRAQFDISDDFSRAAYISGYGDEKYRGALMTMSIVNGYVGTEKRISDNAYGCHVSSDGATVRFAADYNEDLNTVNLLAYTNSNTVTLKENVCAGAFTYDAAGEMMVYAVDVQSAPINSGNIECVTTKGRVRDIQKGASSYGLKKDGRILLLMREAEGENPTGKLYTCNEKGGGRKLIDEEVTKALFY